MPRTAVDYLKTIIYKIVCKDLSVKDLYVGHTTDFIRRKYKHMSICRNPEHKNHSSKLYECIGKNGRWDNWEMVEIEKYPCTDSNEARSRERFWYENLIATLNTVCPCRSSGEKNKLYREKNADVIKAHKGAVEICECGNQYTHAHRQRHFRTKIHKKKYEKSIARTINLK